MLVSNSITDLIKIGLGTETETLLAEPYPLQISGAMGWPRIMEGENEGNPVVCGGVVTSEHHQSVVRSCFMLNFGDGSFKWTEINDLPWPLAFSGILFFLSSQKYSEPELLNKGVKTDLTLRFFSRLRL